MSSLSSRNRPKGMLTPLQLFKSFQKLREYLGDEEAFEALVSERDDQWHIAAQRAGREAGAE